MLHIQIYYLISCPNLMSYSNVFMCMCTCKHTCQVTCWLCLSADSHHLNAQGSSAVCCHRPHPLRSWFHRRGVQMGWQEKLTADHSKPLTVKWVQSQEEPSLCSAKRHRQGLVETMHCWSTNGCIFITSTIKRFSYFIHRWAFTSLGVRAIHLHQIVAG